jgi:hypothetical protein
MQNSVRHPPPNSAIRANDAAPELSGAAILNLAADQLTLHWVHTSQEDIPPPCLSRV